MRGVDIAEHALGYEVFADDAIRPGHIQPGAVGAEHLAGINHVVGVSPAATDADGVPNGGSVGHVTSAATCPAGTVLLYGGGQFVQASVNGMADSSVYLQDMRVAGNTFTVEGVIDIGAQGTVKLQADAYCLQAGGQTAS